MKLRNKIRGAIFHGNPKTIFETAKAMTNRDGSLSDKEKFVVVDLIDALVGENLLDFSNSYLTEKALKVRENEDRLKIMAKEILLKAYNKIESIGQWEP